MIFVAMELRLFKGYANQCFDFVKMEYSYLPKLLNFVKLYSLSFKTLELDEIYLLFFISLFV